MHSRRVSTLLIALALLVAGCDSGGSNSSSSPDDPDTPDETVIADDAVVVDPAEASLQSMRGDTLTFSLTDDAPNFEAGTVVVGEEDGGFLRRVVSVESSGGQATLLTEPAALTDVLEKGELSKTIDLSAEASKDGRGWTAVRTAPGVRAKATNLGIQLDGVSVTGSTTSDLDITLSNGQAAYTPEIDVEVDVEVGRRLGAGRRFGVGRFGIGQRPIQSLDRCPDVSDLEDQRPAEPIAADPPLVPVQGSVREHARAAADERAGHLDAESAGHPAQHTPA
jgi:hypothetical protein